MKMTKEQRALEWLWNYRDGRQNDKPYPVNSVWTRFKGTTHRGLRECQELLFVTSEPDDTINPDGWRHDITPSGRAALSAKEGE